MMKRAVFAATVAAMASTPALAVDSSKSVNVGADPEKVWRVIGDFCGIEDWHPAVESCAIDKKDAKMRTLTLKGGGTIVEKLTERDDKKMSYSYAIVESPLPVANYKSTIKVSKAGAGSTVSWTGTYKAKGASAAEAKKAIDGIYEAGLEGVAKGAN